MVKSLELKLDKNKSRNLFETKKKNIVWFILK
jgi:hypothetical protein